MSDVPYRKPLVIVGALAEGDRTRVLDFLRALGAPVFAEALSGLREDESIAELRIRSGERILARGGFDGVIRIGAVPSLRFWRDLEESRRDVPVAHFARLPFAGMTRGEVKSLDALPSPSRRDRDASFFEADGVCAAAIDRLLADEPQSEPAIFRRLSLEVPHGARVYLGNSLPIREWDAFATREQRGFAIEANRGANGIDGQLSTFFGWCAPNADNVAIVGDLTALYDMNAPWIVPQFDRGTRFRIIIINNGGGKIFTRVPSLRRLDRALRERIIENVHDLDFSQWAAMWRLEHFDEIRPDAEATARFWERYDALW